MTVSPTPLLSAPLVLQFDYTRSLGPVLGRFMAGLRDRRVFGIRGSDGRVHVPPVEYDPVTYLPLSEFVEVSDTGTVETWSWMDAPLPGQPLEQPFAWALITLDGADTPILHAVDVTPDAIHTGLRVRIRWAQERVGSIRDIACFEPWQGGESAPDPAADGDETTSGVEAAGAPVEIMISPVHLEYQHSASREENRFLRGLLEGRLIGQRCPVCLKVYIPPRGACPVDGVPTEEEVPLPDRGTVTTFCIVNVPFLGQRITPPYVAAYILLDGADIAFQHLILDCSVEDVRMGMRVEAVWRPRDEWRPTLENIDHFRPTGEPDAPYDSYAQHQ